MQIFFLVGIVTVLFFIMPFTFVSGLDSTEIKLQESINKPTLSPLKQLQSGISSQHIQCDIELELIFKSSDGSPACVKTGTKIKLVERGWGMMSNLVFTNNISENNCEQFYTAPKIQYGSNTVPVLLMGSNSTGCMRLTFIIDHSYSTTTWPQIASFTSDHFIGNYNYTSHGIIFSVSPGKDYTNSFQIIVVPKTIDLANFPMGSNFTVTYIIKPLSNATGFYDYSGPKLPCEHYPLVVGYTADHVNYTDFSYINQQIHSCEAGPYRLIAVEISGMIFKDIALPLDSSNG